jgi:BlaI family transcriptional regulator, penicillinase repressor
MKELTKAEEQVMQILWKMEEGFVRDIINRMSEPKPAYNTVSTIIRILEQKGFVGHKAYGRTHMYFPLITKKEYTKTFFKTFMKNYFSNSYQQLVSFFSKEDNLSLKEMEQLMEVMKQEIEKKKNNQNT